MPLFKSNSKNPVKQEIANLRKHRGMNDLLSYLILLDQGTIVHKDGALSRHFRYIAPDLDSVSPADLDYHAKTWQNSFNFLGDGWMVETNMISQSFDHYYNSREFPDVVSALIDDERRLQYKNHHYFKSTYYLTLTYKPKYMVESWLRRFAIDTAQDKSTELSALDENIEKFDEVVKNYIGYLSRSLIFIEPLGRDELTTFLHQCITGDRNRLYAPRRGAFLDVYLAQDFIAGFRPKIGKKWIKVLGIEDVPSHAYPALLDTLSHFPIEYRWSSRFICLDNVTARAYLKRYERNWSSKAIGVLGVVKESLGMPVKLDEDAQQMAGQLRTAQNDISAGNVGNGFYNSVLVLMHEDEAYLNKVSEVIASKIRQMDFQIRQETVNATEAYLGSLPCHGDYNLRKMPVDTDFVSCVLPISSAYPGESKAPCPLEGYKDQPILLLATTQGSRPFMLNLHVVDVGHTAILGPTGAGKTTLNAILMASHRKYPGSRIVVLDKDYSNRMSIKALGGDYFDLAKNECALAPLARINFKDITQSYQIDNAVLWLAECCAIQGISMTSQRQILLREAIERLAKDEAHYHNLNHLSIQDPELRQAIQVFNSGSFAKLLNGTKAEFSGRDVIGFEMSSLIKSDSQQNDLCIPVIKAIFNELEELFKDRRPTLLILEEAWLYLRHPLFREKLTDWFKTLRKANVSVIFISQDLDDIVKSNSASVIQSSCMTKIFLPNKSAAESYVSEQYKAFGLNDTQISIIQKSTPKKDYYYHSPLGNRLFQLDLEELALAFLGISQKSDLDKFDELYRQNDSRWVLDWLSYKGLKQWQDFAIQHYFGGRDHVQK